MIASFSGLRHDFLERAPDLPRIILRKARPQNDQCLSIPANRHTQVVHFGWAMRFDGAHDLKNQPAEEFIGLLPREGPGGGRSFPAGDRTE